MAIKFLDLEKEFQLVQEPVKRAINEVLESRQFIGGKFVKRFEDNLCAYLGHSTQENVIGVSSGTDALLMCLMAEGIGPGDEVITTPYSFIATADVIERVGATPVFVDIDFLTFNINHDLIEEKITERTKAIIPVHLFGFPCYMTHILEIAKKHNLIVIEDAAQALGSKYLGNYVGTLGDYGCFSFFPSKNLGGMGDGGAIYVSDYNKRNKIKKIKAHGKDDWQVGRFVTLGGNFRLDALQANVLNAKLEFLDYWITSRIVNAKVYNSYLEKGRIEVPDLDIVQGLGKHSFNQYTILIPEGQKRNHFLLTLNGITETMHYYKEILPLTHYFQNKYGYTKEDFPVAFDYSQRAVSLPIYPRLGEENIERISKALINITGEDK